MVSAGLHPKSISGHGSRNVERRSGRINLKRLRDGKRARAPFVRSAALGAEKRGAPALIRRSLNCASGALAAPRLTGVPSRGIKIEHANHSEFLRRRRAVGSFRRPAPLFCRTISACGFPFALLRGILDLESAVVLAEREEKFPRR